MVERGFLKNEVLISIFSKNKIVFLNKKVPLHGKGDLGIKDQRRKLNLLKVVTKLR